MKISITLWTFLTLKLIHHSIKPNEQSNMNYFQKHEYPVYQKIPSSFIQFLSEIEQKLHWNSMFWWWKYSKDFEFYTHYKEKLFTGLWLLEQNDKKREKWTVIKQKTEIYLAKYFPKHTQINFNYQRGKIVYK